jgi:hypothetical protein
MKLKRDSSQPPPPPPIVASLSTIFTFVSVEQPPEAISFPYQEPRPRKNGRGHGPESILIVHRCVEEKFTTLHNSASQMGKIRENFRNFVRRAAYVKSKIKGTFLDVCCWGSFEMRRSGCL